MSDYSTAVVQRRVIADVDEFAFSENIDPLLQRIYRARNLLNENAISLSLKDLLSPSGLMGLDDAVELIIRCMDDQSLILVVGDFDADGATSCALALRALKAFGHSNVQFLVPNRFEYGYGSVSYTHLTLPTSG